MKSHLSCIAFLCLFFGWADSSAGSDVGGKPDFPGPGQAAALSPSQRGELTREFVVKWGSHVERVYGVDVGVWARRMVESFVAADGVNFKRSLRREKFEHAIAELNGMAVNYSDPQSMTAKVERSYSGASRKVLGDSIRDLVYTPIPPCRVVDTRIAASGAIPANSTRSFLAVSNNYSAQGGSAIGCGLSSIGSIGAVAMNVASVTPSGAGYATVYPYNDQRPATASINYASGSVVNNTIIAAIPSPLRSSDFSIYSFAQSHFVVDIVGYFSAPVATALQCGTGDSRSGTVLSGAQDSVFPPPCPFGFAAVSNNCIASSAQVYLSEVTMIGCTFRNTSSSTQTITSAYTCCRVPGR